MSGNQPSDGLYNGAAERTRCPFAAQYCTILMSNCSLPICLPVRHTVHLYGWFVKPPAIADAIRLQADRESQ